LLLVFSSGRVPDDDGSASCLAECWLQVVQEITEELEAKLMEEQMNYTQLQTQKDEMVCEFEEVKLQLGEDADRCTSP
jgi:uncharacterized coiled-coil protein SlyX